jgi:hypothetical protein
MNERARPATKLSPDAPADGATRRPALRARPLFTRHCRPFWGALSELIGDHSSPDDFCNCVTTCELPNPSSSILAGTKAMTFFLFGRTTQALLRESVARGEPRIVRSRKPRCRFLPLARACPTAIPNRPRHTRPISNRLASVEEQDELQ